MPVMMTSSPAGRLSWGADLCTTLRAASLILLVILRSGIFEDGSRGAATSAPNPIVFPDTPHRRCEWNLAVGTGSSAIHYYVLPVSPELISEDHRHVAKEPSLYPRPHPAPAGSAERDGGLCRPSPHS